MNNRTKFDAARCILAEEIRNRTNTQNQTNKQTNNKQTKTVNDIPTLPIGMYR